MLAAARIHLSPAESRALGRAVGWLVRELGWGWGLTTIGGVMLVGWAAWTFPTWWPTVQDRWEALLEPAWAAGLDRTALIRLAALELAARLKPGATAREHAVAAKPYAEFVDNGKVPPL